MRRATLPTRLWTGPGRHIRFVVAWATPTESSVAAIDEGRFRELHKPAYRTRSSSTVVGVLVDDICQLACRRSPEPQEAVA